MNSTKWRAGLGILLGATTCLAPTMPAQTGPVLVAQMYAGITVTGVVNATYTIEAITNLTLTNGWVVLTNVVLPTSPWVYIDYASPGMAQRFYRARALDTNAPSGMAPIPAGSFTMGDSLYDTDDSWNERPLHTVQVSAFYMDKTEVTKALWDEVYTWAVVHGYGFDNPGLSKGTNHPVHTVNWYNMVKWCNARSEKEGRIPAYYLSSAYFGVYRNGRWEMQNNMVNWNAGYRLPTEAEWEYAARGGLSEKRFPWGDAISHTQANYFSGVIPGSKLYYNYDISISRSYHPNYRSDGMPYTSPVGSFAPNGYGLYDMAGNMGELCWDWFDSYSWDTQTDPHGPASSGVRVMRGGSWFTDAFQCRAAHRTRAYLDTKDSNIGFRCVLPASQ
jgi:formylglycine-generating enzyme